MDQQLEDVIAEQVDDEHRAELIKEILRYENAKLGLSHRRGKVEKIRSEVQKCLQEQGEIL